MPVLLQKSHENTSTSREVMAKLQPLTSAIEQYGEALDVYANAYPLALSPLWGSLRVVLLLAREFGKYFEKLVDMFERIGDVLPRFRAYERLFPNNERLVQSLSVAYVDILKFCSDVKAVFRRSKRPSIINMKVFSKLIWKPFDLQFGDCLRKLRDHKKTVEKEAELSHMIESADSRALVLANRLQLEKEKKEHDWSRMLFQLSTVSHEDLHRRQRRSCHPSTGLWALNTPDYVDWKSSGGSGGLCCYGIPGCGKTILASTIIEDLLLEKMESATVLIYYYCSYADPRSLVKAQILGNLLRQLILCGAVSEDVELELLGTFLKEGRIPEDDKLVQEIQSAVQRRQGVYVVLDGIDECENETRQYILSLLIRLTDCKFFGARILLTCREESQVLDSVHEWPQIQLNEAALINDMRVFVISSIRLRIKNGQLRIKDPSLEQEVITALVEKAHGMFLWIHFQLIDLCAAMSPAQIRMILQNLPDGLGETYERILARISESSTRSRFALRTFRWLACARRPLLMEEMQEAVAFDQSDKAWDPTKIPDQDLLIRACHGLVIRDHVDGTVRFAHYSVRQYLVVNLSDWENRLPRNGYRASDFQFSMVTAQLDAAKVCIAYLNFADFETAIVNRAPGIRFNNSGILGPGGPGAIASTLGMGKPILGVVYRMLGGRATLAAPDIDFTKYLQVRPKPDTPESSEKHKILGYILQNWPWHVDIYGNFCRDVDIFGLGQVLEAGILVASKTLPFEFRPWGPNRHFGPYGCKSCWTENGETVRPSDLPMTSMMHWAAMEGLVGLFIIVYIGHSDAYHNLLDSLFHERYSNETMLIACRNGRTSVVEYLAGLHYWETSHSNLCVAASASGHAETLATLFRIGKVNFEKDAQPSFFKAATNGHASIVKILLQHDLDPYTKEHRRFFEEIDEITGLTPLHASAANGHIEVVRLLAEAYLDVDIKDMRTGSTPLHYAAKNGHTQVVTALLSCDVSVDHMDKSEMTPLLLAAKNGHTQVVTALISYDASLEDTDELGMTPLMLAAKNGHIAVVKCLLEGGSSVDERSCYWTLAYAHTHFGDSTNHLITPLMWAAANGYTEVVDLLSNCVRKIDRTDEKGRTAVHLAAAGGHVETLNRLLKGGAQNSSDDFGWNAIHFAATHGYDNCIEILSAEKKYLDACTYQTYGAQTPLHIATKAGHRITILTLGRLGAELKIMDASSRTAFETSFAQKNRDTALALLEAEEAQIHRPRLWKLVSLAQGKQPMGGVLCSWGSTTCPEDCISDTDFNEHDISYANMLLDRMRDVPENLHIRSELVSKLSALGNFHGATD